MAGSWRRRWPWWRLPVLLAVGTSCPSDPLAGRRFACEPGVEGQCLPGWWCQPVTGKGYKGVCVREGEGWDAGPRDPGSDDSGGTCGACPAGTSCEAGVCKPTCWTGPCPSGYQQYDGCRCKVAPTGATQCKIPGQKGLVACSTIKPGDPGYGQDGHFPTGSLAFTDLGDGTVRDEHTGLIWQKGTAPSEKTWADANAYCTQNQAGLPGSGWRLPSVVELLSLVDYSKECPMWPAVFGTSCPSVSWFWTSEKTPWSSSSAFHVYFHNGYVGLDGVGGYSGVRCVRAGQ